MTVSATVSRVNVGDEYALRPKNLQRQALAMDFCHGVVIETAITNARQLTELGYVAELAADVQGNDYFGRDRQMQLQRQWINAAIEAGLIPIQCDAPLPSIDDFHERYIVHVTQRSTIKSEQHGVFSFETGIDTVEITDPKQSYQLSALFGDAQKMDAVQGQLESRIEAGIAWRERELTAERSAAADRAYLTELLATKGVDAPGAISAGRINATITLTAAQLAKLVG